MKQYTQYNPSTWRKSVFGRLGGVVCACMGMHANISTLVQGIKRTKAIIKLERKFEGCQVHLCKLYTPHLWFFYELFPWELNNAYSDQACAASQCLQNVVTNLTADLSLATIKMIAGKLFNSNLGGLST